MAKQTSAEHRTGTDEQFGTAEQTDQVGSGDGTVQASDGARPGQAGSAGWALAASTDASLNQRTKSTDHGRRGLIWAIVAATVVVAFIVGFVLVRGRGKSDAAPAGRPSSKVTVGLKLAPSNLDIRNQSGSALDQLLIGNVYEGLVARDADNHVVPSLAQSWDQNADGTLYTFHLNPGMTFSNGHKLDSEDVVWSIRELVSKQYHNADQLKNLQSIEAPDANTVELRLSAPYSSLLWVLTGRPGLVFDKGASYDMKTQAVGSGPYLLTSFVPNDSATLQANRKYWGERKAKTPTVVVRYLGDDNAAVNALKSKDVQVLAPITENLATPFRSDKDHYQVQAGDDTDKYVLAFNSKGPKTADLRVRQAIRHTIDHQELIASRGGSDKALGGPIPSLDPGYEDLTGLYKHDVAKARELMAQAGYSPANPLELRLTYANTYGTELGDQLRSQLKPIGIDLKVNVVEFSTWLQDVYQNHDYDLSLVDHNESHDFSQWTSPDYYYGYDNPKVRRLYDQAMASTKPKDTSRLLAQAARQVSQDAPADWLFNYRVTTAELKGVKGFPLNLNQTLMPLRDLTYCPGVGD
ncbi:ABC transporter substrate-binding protein [Bifidobacterium aemilianum]|uniref:ABC transporter substrate-binding protein n=1 Tax=Bifidobacterium aemilianum TaxID=2493120 RepID=A0A366KAW7_9BIFI|nr:ABC transporter substrate-binding protein [Bifidobacterium aemilianum]RBP98308.1 ABC transporter substrate-binding protein [Bifidobacterium aemilianum]